MLVVILASMVVFATAASTELSERINHAAGALERLQIDEVPLALLTFSLGLAWFAWRRWREMQLELQHRLSIERALALKQSELRELSRRVTEAQEGERRLLAHELHDELGQSLNAIKIEAVVVRNQSHRMPEIHRAALAVIRLTDHVYEVVRSMTGRLRPVALDELGLAGAIEHGLAGWRQLAPATEFLWRVGNLPAKLDEAVAMAVYRVVQESVTNILRHAAATQVVIALESDRQQSRLHLAVRDNGRGADLATARRGLGLLGMRERMEGLGGSLTIASRPGDGFLVEATVPVHCREPAGGRA